MPSLLVDQTFVCRAQVPGKRRAGPRVRAWRQFRARGELSVSIAAQSPMDLYGERRPPGKLSSMVLADFQLSVLLYRRAHLFAIVDDGLRDLQ
jgi:hypothetical protein